MEVTLLAIDIYDEEQFETDSEVTEFIGKLDTTKRGFHIPTPPPKGTYITCQWCGKNILPSELSPIKDIRQKEVKWQIHEACRKQTIAQLDNDTPGLRGERWRAEKRRRAIEESEKPVVIQRKKSFLEMSAGNKPRGRGRGGR